MGMISRIKKFGISRLFGLLDTATDGAVNDGITANWGYDHNAAKTGVHQAGANNLATDADITTHAADTSTHGVTTVDGVTERNAAIATHAAAIDAHVAMMLANLMQGGFPHFIPLNYGWSEIKSGSGTTTASNPQDVGTGITASSTAARHHAAHGFGMGLTGGYIDWDYPIYLYIPYYSRNNSDTECVARIQLKAQTTAAIGALAEIGFGIEIANYALTGESYGAARGTVDLATTLANNLQYALLIIFTPGVSVAFYVDTGGGFALKGTYSTAANVPSGNSTTYTRFFHSIVNGATGGVNAVSYMSEPVIWQRRTV